MTFRLRLALSDARQLRIGRYRGQDCGRGGTWRGGSVSRGDARSSRIDVVEMYWAGQSRLANSGSRILSELFTLVFRLSRLGRDTVLGVHPKESSSRRWRPFAWSQWLVDHVLVHMLAMLALSFAFSVAIMCALAIVASWEPATVQNAAATAALADEQRCVAGHSRQAFVRRTGDGRVARRGGIDGLSPDFTLKKRSPFANTAGVLAHALIRIAKKDLASLGRQRRAIQRIQFEAAVTGG